jgi:hypothetical protein
METSTTSRARPRQARHRLAWLLAAMLLAPGAARAQLVPGLPIMIELRTGAALPVGDVSRESPGLGAGAGLGAALALHIRLTTYLSAYGGYDYERFGCGACGAAGLEGGMPEAGFEAGVEWTLPFRLGAAEPWLSAGALLARRLEIPDGGDGFASESAMGWSLGAGVRLPVAPSLQLLPGIRFRSYSTRFDFPDLGFGLFGADALEQDMRVASVALEVGLSYEL